MQNSLFSKVKSRQINPGHQKSNFFFICQFIWPIQILTFLDKSTLMRIVCGREYFSFGYLIFLWFYLLGQGQVNKDFPFIDLWVFLATKLKGHNVYRIFHTWMGQPMSVCMYVCVSCSENLFLGWAPLSAGIPPNALKGTLCKKICQLNFQRVKNLGCTQ